MSEPSELTGVEADLSDRQVEAGQRIGDLHVLADPLLEMAVALTRRYAAYVVTERQHAPVIEGKGELEAGRD